MTIISKTLPELVVGDVIVDPRGKRHKVIAPVEPAEEDGSEFYPELAGKVYGFAIKVEYWCPHNKKFFTETRTVYPEFIGGPEAVTFRVEVP